MTCGVEYIGSRAAKEVVEVMKKVTDVGYQTEQRVQEMTTLLFSYGTINSSFKVKEWKIWESI